MERQPTAEPAQGLMNLAERRTAIRSLGAMAAALFGVRAFTPAASAQDDGSAVSSERRRKRRKRGKRGKKGKRGNRGPSGPSGPSGPQGPAGPVNSVLVAGDIAALPAQGGAGQTATSVATCAASSVLLGCGYELSTETPEDLRALNNTIGDVVPDVDAGTCTATLYRTDFSNGQVTVAPQIQAFAVCRA